MSAAALCPVPADPDTAPPCCRRSAVVVNIFTVISFLEIAPASKYDDGPYILPEKPWTLSG